MHCRANAIDFQPPIFDRNTQNAKNNQLGNQEPEAGELGPVRSGPRFGPVRSALFFAQMD
jgi:hypothetical protein